MLSLSSVVQEGLNDEKTGGRKSRLTVPLNNGSICPLTLIYQLYSLHKPDEGPEV